MKMTGRVIVIAGASRGIGAAAAREFVAEGARVVLLSRDKGALKALSADLGDAAMAFPCDVSEFRQVEQAILEGCTAFGGCDVLVNNAAVIEPIGGLHDMDPKAFGTLMDINVNGVFHGIRAALPLMLASGSGTIINISSGAANQAYEGWAGYCASKAAVKILTESVHLDYGAQGIRSLGLSPGTVATEMQRVIKRSGVGPVAELEWEDHIPPEWPAKALVWMATEAADPYLGGDIRLKTPEILEQVGLA